MIESQTKKRRVPTKTVRKCQSFDTFFKNTTLIVLVLTILYIAFVLFVPGAAGSARRVELKSVAPYQEALEVIYDNIGCSDVIKKPELSYKLSTATAKAVSISLNSEKDWKGFQKEVISQQKTKKRSIPVNILVPDRVCITYLLITVTGNFIFIFQYLKSLEAMGKKSGRSQTVGRSIKNKKMVLMDLNGDSDDENHDDGTMEREKQALEQLERALTRCQLCGPGKFCKISKTGDHVNLTWGQRRAWSIALACTIRIFKYMSMF